MELLHQHHRVTHEKSGDQDTDAFYKADNKNAGVLDAFELGREVDDTERSFRIHTELSSPRGFCPCPISCCL